MTKMPFMSIVFFFIILLNSIEIQAGVCRWSQGVNIDGVCFLLNTTQLTYNESKAYCVSIGGALATVNTMTQFNAIAAMANVYDSIWIGANDIAVEGVWRWEDSGDLATELTGYWEIGQPDDDGNVADCVDIYIGYCRSWRLWDDDCNFTYSFVCMDKASAITPTTTESTTTVISSPTTPSVNCRWPGSIYVDGGCFLYNSTLMTYAKAKAFCLSIGGVLATITTTNQMSVLTAKANDGDSVWIGANDKSVEGTWRWEDTGALATELSGLWDVASGQPDNYNNDDCADIYVRCLNVELWDDPCTSKYSFICMEKAPTTTKVTTKITTTQKLTTTTVPTNTSTLQTTKTILSTIETAILTAETTLPTTPTTLPNAPTTIPTTTTPLPTSTTTLPSTETTLSTKPTTTPTTLTALPTTITTTVPTTTTTLPSRTSALNNTTTSQSSTSISPSTTINQPTTKTTDTATSSPNLDRDELTSSFDSAQPMTQYDGSILNLNQRVDVEARAEVDTTTSTPSSAASEHVATSESIPFNQTLAIVSCVVGFLIASVLMIIIVAVCKACKACSKNKVHAF
ncbi:unnamed protein product [Lymnaea stagnalis]|uniref:C-type lectin domain-containing protein n=1 Tax=Lymnaea stagnalis TaxID=6523 RepID=A0AAV2HAH1_LYMST